MTGKKIITLTDGRTVYAEDYIKAKTTQLKEFGYNSLNEKAVGEQLDKILKNENDLTVIGHFIKDDIKVK